ncbi:hypothetical protein HDU76_003247 [Blyttiomyces sp. JEL0837]|nr:hypothetical protein HDU76_003247 [Blyttiomyces sp. JEL0837]
MANPSKLGLPSNIGINENNISSCSTSTVRDNYLPNVHVSPATLMASNQCQHCNVTFKKSQQLTKHMRTTHKLTTTRVTTTQSRISKPSRKSPSLTTQSSSATPSSSYASPSPEPLNPALVSFAPRSEYNRHYKSYHPNSNLDDTESQPTCMFCHKFT